LSRWQRALIGALIAVIILTPMTALYQGQQTAQKNDRARTALINRNARDLKEQNRRLATATQQQNRELLANIQDLLDRPVVTVKTIRRVVNQNGVRKVIITRTVFRGNKVITRVVYRTKTKVVIRYIIKYIVICRMPNGKPCKTKS